MLFRSFKKKKIEDYKIIFIKFDKQLYVNHNKKKKKKIEKNLIN